jgi:hypothetical protein
MFELLLRVKEAVGEEIFKDALAITQATTPPRHPSGEALREGAARMITLPYIFICEKEHKHPIRTLDYLLRGFAPRCLLRRIVLEWAALSLTSLSEGVGRG